MMSLLDSTIKFYLSGMKIVHGHLMGIQYIPNRTQRESGLLKPLAQFLEGFGLRRAVHMLMGTHGINLKEVESVVYK